MNSINLYGDKLVPAGTGHGADIASQRQDDLDLMAITHISKNQKDQNILAIDFGAGHGAQAARMAQAGAANVIAIDMHNFSDEPTYNTGTITFIQNDLTSPDLFPLIQSKANAKIDVALSQRTIHYLTYEQARKFLMELKVNMNPNAKLFISASGIRSELGLGYAHIDHDISTRFSMLSSEMAQKHGIMAPVCLYDLHELVELCESAGFKIIQSYASSFGNIKVAAESA